MLRSYLKIALRNLLRQKGYAFINIAGLAVGLACCFLIVLFIQHERSFDRFHERADRIHRLLRVNSEGERLASTASGYAVDLFGAFSEIESSVRVANYFSGSYIKVGPERRQVDGFVLADPSIFQVFSFHLLRGDPRTALADPHALVVSERGARLLFGEEDPIGKTVIFGESAELMVTGVMADVPTNATLSFDYVGSFNILTQWASARALNEYTNHNYDTYFLLREGTDAGALEQKFGPWFTDRFGPGSGSGLELQPLTRIHFDTGIKFDTASTRDVRYLYVFSAVAVLLVLIACVNFTNLATARAAKRAKEVGVRKTIGARHRQLVAQFLGESVMLSVLSIILALILVGTLLPALNALLGVGIQIDEQSLWIVAVLVGIGLGAGLLAGAYPALYLSRFNTVRVLKGQVARGGQGAWLRQGLIVFQFAASLALIVGTITVYNQLDFMRSQDVGFDKEQVIVFQAPRPLRSSFDAFEQALVRDPRILSAALGTPPGRVGTNRGYNWPGRRDDGEERGMGLWTMIAGPEYVETMGMNLVEGRGFASVADTHDTYILNETAVRELGLQDPVGHPFRAWDRPMGQIIGVVSDFHFTSLHQRIEPVVINFKPDWTSTVAVRMAPGDLSGAIESIHAQWMRFAPDFSFSYSFLDEDFDRAYRSEEQLVHRFSFFAAIAIFIACLGLFGLAAFAAQQRTKEIGVRKVLGASVPQVVMLLARDFVKLVLVALVVAAPVAFFGMSRWLDGFAYRISIGPGVFLLAGTLAVLLAFFTVSYQAIRAALADPVRALRYE